MDFLLANFHQFQITINHSICFAAVFLRAIMQIILQLSDTMCARLVVRSMSNENKKKLFTWQFLHRSTSLCFSCFSSFILPDFNHSHFLHSLVFVYPPTLVSRSNFVLTFSLLVGFFALISLDVGAEKLKFSILMRRRLICSFVSR